MKDYEFRELCHSIMSVAGCTETEIEDVVSSLIGVAFDEELANKILFELEEVIEDSKIELDIYFMPNE